jgi:hypothetical protein
LAKTPFVHRFYPLRANIRDDCLELLKRSEGRTMWIVDAQRGDGKRFIVRSDEKLSAFVELERQVLTVTFYLASIDAECAGGLS